LKRGELLTGAGRGDGEKGGWGEREKGRKGEGVILNFPDMSNHFINFRNQILQRQNMYIPYLNQTLSCIDQIFIDQ
jgi:hypothetical protein